MDRHPKPKAVPSKRRSIFLSHSPYGSAKKISGSAFVSFFHASITKGSLTEMQMTSSKPLALSASNARTKSGTCVLEHTGVNAPGRPKMTTFFSRV